MKKQELPNLILNFDDETTIEHILQYLEEYTSDTDIHMDIESLRSRFKYYFNN